MPTQPYELAFTLHAHSSDVRNICVPSPGIPILLSGSRDGSAVMWGPATSGKEWDVKLRVEGPEKRYIGCTGMVRSQGEAFLLTGSSNGVLSSFMLPSATSPPPSGDGLLDPYHTLIEHKQNLCCMDTSKGGLVATGSWDKSAIIWKDFKLVVRIQAHEQAVWAVKFVGEDRVLTASADNKILLHSFDITSGNSTILQTYTGNTQPVRGLSLRQDGKSFWSCSNDSSVNLYSFDKPSPIRTLSGHTSFVYGVAALPDGGVVSSGEDGTLRVWSETELVQTISHPCTSIWSCAVIPIPGKSSYYIASSANDGMIRFFTNDSAMMAPQSEREAWEKDISSRQLDKSQVGDVKHSDLPGMEALGREGKSEGQVIMIKNNNKVEAYQWQSASKTWQQIGEVVDAVGSGRKQLYQGKEYDYVFDVDIAEGVPALKLPYNVAENPWIAAQRFLETNDLPLTYTEQVVNFITTNTGGVQLGQETSSYVDPYTGASRYTGGGVTAAGSSAGGASRPGNTSTNNSYGGASDPFTGTSAYSSTSTSKPSVAGVLPVKTYLSFKQMNINAAKSKINQLNDELKAKDASLAFTASDEKNLSEIYALLGMPSSVLPNPNGDGSGERYDPITFLNMIQKWPSAYRFPLLDLARCLSAISPSFGRTPIAPQIILDLAGWTTPDSSDTDKTKETNSLLLLRGLANLCSTKSGRSTMGGSASVVLNALNGKGWGEFGKGKQAGATVALNYSVMAVEGSFPVDQSSGLLEFISLILNNETTDSEVIYRASVALGNLILSPSVAGSLQIGRLQSLKSTITSLADKLGEKRLKDLASEINSFGA